MDTTEQLVVHACLYVGMVSSVQYTCVHGYTGEECSALFQGRDEGQGFGVTSPTGDYQTGFLNSVILCNLSFNLSNDSNNFNFNIVLVHQL